MKHTIYGAFDKNGIFIRAGRYLTDSPSSRTANLKNFAKDVEIRILGEARTPAEAIFETARYNELFKDKQVIKPVIKETVKSNGTVIKKMKVTFE